MSTILKAQLAWRPDWGNSPDLKVLLDKQPAWDSLRFQERDGLYLATDGDFANYIYWVGPGNTGGYGGRIITVTMVDGTTRELAGPWSSRAECVNAAFPETPIIEAGTCDSLAVFERGYTFTAAAVTIDALKRIGEFELYPEPTAKTSILTTVAYLARLENGTYDFVINEGHGWETKDMWCNRIKDWGQRQESQPVEIFGS